MDIQDNHTTILLNAKCELVNSLYTICKKSEYGDNELCCCSDELYLKSKLIRRLECYNFPSSVVETTTNGTLTATGNLSSIALGDYYLHVSTTNGDSYYPYSVTSSISKLELIILLFNSAGFLYSYTSGEDSFTVTVIIDCSVLSIHIESLNINVVSFIEGVSPVCVTSTVTVDNCITESDLPKMYEVLKKL
jgi:hypothetical protein